jgi:hypothetical protein
MLRLASLSTFALSLCLVACGTATIANGNGGGGSGGSTSSSSSSSSSSTGGPTCSSLGGTCVPDPGSCQGSFTGTGQASYGCSEFGPGGCCLPAADTCTPAGGTCVPIVPDGCMNGTWGDASMYSCGQGVGTGCCLPPSGGKVCSPSMDTCGTNEWCAYADNKCGQGEPTGVCKSGPLGCEDLVAQVCGCDGMVYQYDCVAHEFHADVSVLGNCAAPAGDFPCGPAGFCPLDMYCARTGTAPDHFTCQNLPAACAAAPSCACLEQQSPCMVTGCSGDAASGIVLQCG